MYTTNVGTISDVTFANVETKRGMIACDMDIDGVQIPEWRRVDFQFYIIYFGVVVVGIKR
jgi:hypothetical protein